MNVILDFTPGRATVVQTPEDQARLADAARAAHDSAELVGSSNT